LGAVAGGGIGQIHPAVALAVTTAVQIRPRQADYPVVLAVQPDRQAAGLGVEGGDHPSAAVGHPELADGIVTTDDPVPDRQLAVLDLQPLGAEATLGGQELLTGGVEPVDLGPAGGQHDDLLGRVSLRLLVGGPPVLE
jgi:hypothetical protein